MFDSNVLRDENGIYYLGDYHPFKRNGMRNPLFDDYAGLILDLKENKGEAKNYFSGRLNDALLNNPNLAILCVPSHEAFKKGPNNEIIQLVCSHRGMVNGSNCLVRHTTVDKLASGGRRDIDVHLNSIRLENSRILENRDILIVDDVSTSGNSLKACEAIVRRNVRSIKSLSCLVYGRTI